MDGAPAQQLTSPLQAFAFNQPIESHADERRPVVHVIANMLAKLYQLRSVAVSFGGGVAVPVFSVAKQTTRTSLIGVAMRPPFMGVSYARTRAIG